VEHHDHQPSTNEFEFTGVRNLFTVSYRGVFPGIIDDGREILLGQRPGYNRWIKFDSENPPFVYKDALIHRAEFQLIEFFKENKKSTIHVLTADPKPFPSTLYALIRTGIPEFVVTKYPHGVTPIKGAVQIDHGEFVYRDGVNAKEEIWAFKEGSAVGIIFANGNCRVLRCQKGGGPLKEWLELRLENDPGYTEKLAEEFRKKREATAKQAEAERVARETAEAEREASVKREAEKAIAEAKLREEGRVVDQALRLAERFPDDLNREDIEDFDEVEKHPLSREVFFSAICDKIVDMVGRAKKQGMWSKFHCYLLHVLADYADKARMALEVGDFVRSLDAKMPVPIGVMEKLAPAGEQQVSHSPERIVRDKRRAQLRADRLDVAPAKGPSGSKTNLGAEARARREREAKGK
jgi:hypothetical protein